MSIICRYAPCTRWDEVTHSVKVISDIASAAETPTEIRLLNNAEPVVVGSSTDNTLNRITLSAILCKKPQGLTPICMQLCAIVEQLKRLESILKYSDKVILLIIMTDGESTDGDIIDILKPLEGIPIQIIIRVCTAEREISEYWHNINAQLDIEIHVLHDIFAEAMEVYENNPWITYAEPLQKAREFGLMVPEIEKLGKRQLSKSEIKSVIDILLATADSEKSGNIYVDLPDIEIDWLEYVEAVYGAFRDVKDVYCPITKQLRPWINFDALMDYEVDPISIVIEENEVQCSIVLLRK